MGVIGPWLPDPESDLAKGGEGLFGTGSFCAMHQLEFRLYTISISRHTPLPARFGSVEKYKTL